MSTSTSTSTAPTPPPSHPTNPATQDLNIPFQNFSHYIALSFLVVAPVIIALPPRKIDFYTFTLGGGFVFGATHIYRDSRRGFPLFGDARNLSATAGGTGSGGGNGQGKKKTRYEIVQEQLRREKEGRLAAGVRAGGEQRDDGAQGKLGRVWMGGEKSGWKERRLEEEKRKLAEGQGYGDMIMDQIREVMWHGSGGTDQDEDGDDGDDDGDNTKKSRESTERS